MGGFVKKIGRSKPKVALAERSSGVKAWRNPARGPRRDRFACQMFGVTMAGVGCTMGRSSRWTVRLSATRAVGDPVCVSFGLTLEDVAMDDGLTSSPSAERRQAWLHQWDASSTDVVVSAWQRALGPKWGWGSACIPRQLDGVARLRHDLMERALGSPPPPQKSAVTVCNEERNGNEIAAGRTWSIPTCGESTLQRTLGQGGWDGFGCPRRLSRKPAPG